MGPLIVGRKIHADEIKYWGHCGDEETASLWGQPMGDNPYRDGFQN